MSITSTSHRPAVAATRIGFAPLLHAEWTKFRTVRGWVIGMMAAVLVTVLVGLLGPAGSSISCSGPDGKPCEGHTPLTGPGGEPVSDGFYFVHQPLAGDGGITVRITSLTGQFGMSKSSDGSPEPDQGAAQPWAKAGVIVKDSSRLGSAYAAMMLTGGHGVRMQYDYTKDIAGLPGTVSDSAPRWLRLTRSADTIVGYDSADGVRWNQVGTATLAGLPATVQIGLFVTSPEYTVTTQSFGGSSSSGGLTSATASFDQVVVQGASGTLTGEDMGEPGGGPASGGRPIGDHRQTADRFTVTGSGDIAPIVSGQGTFIKTIESGLVGGFAGLIAVIVVSTLFMTGEYRRGLIRTTLAASPARGKVLAAKSIVIAAVTFVTGLVAAIVSIFLVERLETAKGFFVFPVPALTELRVAAGFAAVFAVAAVLALAVGTVVRRSTGAVAVVIVATVLPYIMAIASVLPTGAAQWLLRVTPAAGFAIQQSVVRYGQVDAGYTPADGYFPLPPWAGFAVLCAYAAVVLSLAGYLLRRRDA